MMGKEQSYKAGVLIIGSLYWDNTNGRQSWREHYFGENFHQHGIKASVPIRYGRYSTSRACPTMVLSSKYESESKIGKAIFLPFQNQRQSINDIICSAKALSEAEGNGSRDFIKGRKEKWCVITYKANPLIAESVHAFSEKWIAQYNPKLTTIQDQFKCKCET